MPVRGLVFDVDGTLAETEEAHRRAFNDAFAEAGLDWSWSYGEYRELLKVTGGRERIRAYMEQEGLAPEAADIPALHKRKTVLYGERVLAGEIRLRPGVEALIGTARERGLKLAIATTTSRANVTALFSASFAEGTLGWFDAIFCGEDVERKKPDPEVYLEALRQLGLPAGKCVAFEDSQPGLAAAKAAGLAVVVTPSLYCGGQDFSGADLLIRNLTEPLSGPEMGGRGRLTALPAPLSDLLLALNADAP